MRTIFKIAICIIVIAIVITSIYGVLNADFSGLKDTVTNAYSSASEWVKEKVNYFSELLN